ncbi:hypothetical protein [Streptomyces sp. NPDC050264]|uniref:hypothetical protein n=1 Tax=Streptomyces sp. NPDC050264 TaxID=3155038 RepID=UPI0034334898
MHRRPVARGEFRHAARVRDVAGDLVDGEDGQPCVMELELVEPNLFLSTLHPRSERVVAEAILKAAP